VVALQKDYNVLPGGYSAGMYIAGQCVEAAIESLGGRADDRKALAETGRQLDFRRCPTEEQPPPGTLASGLPTKGCRPGTLGAA